MTGALTTLSRIQGTALLSPRPCAHFHRPTVRRALKPSPVNQHQHRAASTPRARSDRSDISWDKADPTISSFSELPGSNFGVNQHMIIDQDFKEALRQILWKFRAPIRYAFAYGSGVFPQAAPSSTKSASQVHPRPSKAITSVQGQEGKMIDFVFGVSYTQHWHSLNLAQNRHHYSALGSLGSGVVSRVQDNWGAGIYFNPYVTVDGTLIKYGVVNMDTICTDLSDWTNLYLAGRLHKPVKILRDDPRVRLANQVNLLSAVRTALLLLPETFTERELYSTIAGISYLGDLRMAFPTENPQKISNIVKYQHKNFRQLYAPLIDTLPNVSFEDARCSRPEWADDDTVDATLAQDMDPKKRGNMVRRLPKAFRSKLYFAYQSKFQISRPEFNSMMEGSQDEDAQGIKRRQGGPFEQRIAGDDAQSLRSEVRGAIKKTVWWPSVSQSVKGPFTAGIKRTVRYLGEKYDKYKVGRRKQGEEREMETTAQGKSGAKTGGREKSG